jgi:hypothetical protein
VPTNGVLHGILRARGAVKIVMKIMLKWLWHTIEMFVIT